MLEGKREDMPQPVPESVRFDTSWGPKSLEERPECALGVAKVASSWAFLEFWLIEMFFSATGEIEFFEDDEPALIGHPLAVAALSSLESLTAKLDVISAGLEAYLPSKTVEFDQLRTGIRACARERNRIVHAVWGTNQHYPNDVIRVETFTDKHMRYTPKDFDDTVERITIQWKKVEEFDAACRATRIAEFMDT